MDFTTSFGLVKVKFTGYQKGEFLVDISEAYSKKYKNIYGSFDFQTGTYGRFFLIPNSNRIKTIQKDHHKFSAEFIGHIMASNDLVGEKELKALQIALDKREKILEDFNKINEQIKKCRVNMDKSFLKQVQ